MITFWMMSNRRYIPETCSEEIEHAVLSSLASFGGHSVSAIRRLWEVLKNVKYTYIRVGEFVYTSWGCWIYEHGDAGKGLSSAVWTQVVLGKEWIGLKDLTPHGMAVNLLFYRFV